MMTTTHRFGKLLAGVLAGSLLQAAMADGVTATLQGSYITSVQSGPYTVSADTLVVGTSTGTFTPFETHQFSCRAADDLDLGSYFGRENVGAAPWVVRFQNDWVDGNGPAPDFFLFEIGGNDWVEAAPVFPDNSVGQNVALSGWTQSSYTAAVGINKGQNAFGLCFRVTDLKDASGTHLTSAQALRGIRFTSSSIDGALFAAHQAFQSPSGQGGSASYPQVRGIQRMWATTEIWFKGPRSSQFASNPNPFLDYRLMVDFQSPSGKAIVVPGFFDGDGYGNEKGAIWKVRFTPDEAGPWFARAFFRTGPQIAVSTDPNAGSPTYFDGQTTTFHVDPKDPNALGFRKWGRLEFVGKPYLKFREGGYFLKGGTNSPENLLGAYCFANVQDAGNIGRLHAYAPHIADWQNGHPLFIGDTSGVDSKGLIGGLNYLASRGVNSIYFLPMNLGGDGQDVTPFVGYGDSSYEHTHYNVRRLLQWNLVFNHAQSLGMLLHIVLSETESSNENWLDGGSLGLERKLYHREMIARFSHHLAIKWNMGEEWDRPIWLLHQYADHVSKVDPYDHPVSVHVYPGDMNTYNQIAGDPRYTATSMQYDSNQAGSLTEQLRNLGASSGSNWVVDMDENGSASEGLSPWNQEDMRKRVLYDVYFSGGNIEWYLGYNPLPLGGDVDIEDFRTREAMWDYMRHARTFMENNLPFWDMQAGDWLVNGESGSYGGAEVFYKHGSVYAIYLPSANPTGTLNLGGVSGLFTQRWYNPRTGQIEGSSQTVSGNQTVNIGNPPHSASEDWVTWFTVQ